RESSAGRSAHRDRAREAQSGLSGAARNLSAGGGGSDAGAAAAGDQHLAPHRQNPRPRWLQPHRLPIVGGWEAVFSGSESESRSRRQRRIRERGGSGRVVVSGVDRAHPPPRAQALSGIARLRVSPMMQSASAAIESATPLFH